VFKLMLMFFREIAEGLGRLFLPNKPLPRVDAGYFFTPYVPLTQTPFDLRSQHGLDAEAELTAVLSKEIAEEIDREILTDLHRLVDEEMYIKREPYESDFFMIPGPSEGIIK